MHQYRLPNTKKKQLNILIPMWCSSRKIASENNIIKNPQKDVISDLLEKRAEKRWFCMYSEASFVCTVRPVLYVQ